MSFLKKLCVILLICLAGNFLRGSHRWYKLRAQEFYKKVLAVKNPQQRLNWVSLVQFFDRKISNATRILNGEEGLKEAENYNLDEDAVFARLGELISTNMNARAFYYYAVMVGENEAYLMRSKLKCRTDEYFEWEDELERVSQEEYIRRVAEISEAEIERQKFQGSLDFARALIDYIDANDPGLVSELRRRASINK